MSNATTDISMRERDTSRRFKRLREGELPVKEGMRGNESERLLQIKFYIERKSSLLVRRKKLRLRILSWGKETLLASTWKGERRRGRESK